MNGEQGLAGALVNATVRSFRRRRRRTAVNRGDRRERAHIDGAASRRLPLGVGVRGIARGDGNDADLRIPRHQATNDAPSAGGTGDGSRSSRSVASRGEHASCR